MQVEGVFLIGEIDGKMKIVPHEIDLHFLTMDDFKYLYIATTIEHSTVFTGNFMDFTRLKIDTSSELEAYTPKNYQDFVEILVSGTVNRKLLVGVCESISKNINKLSTPWQQIIEQGFYGITQIELLQTYNFNDFYDYYLDPLDVIFVRDVIWQAQRDSWWNEDKDISYTTPLIFTSNYLTVPIISTNLLPPLRRETELLRLLGLDRFSYYSDSFNIYKD